MPYDEFDADDPFELTACEVPLGEEHLGEMAECFIEEFARMGYRANDLFALFREPFYRGPHSVYRALGENYVQDLIEQLVGERPTGAPRGLVQIQSLRSAVQE